jgi:hypothetical protein
VNKKCKGERLGLSHIESKEAMGAIGSYLAKMHNASSSYCKKYPR